MKQNRHADWSRALRPDTSYCAEIAQDPLSYVSHELPEVLVRKAEPERLENPPELLLGQLAAAVAVVVHEHAFDVRIDGRGQVPLLATGMHEMEGGGGKGIS